MSETPQTIETPQTQTQPTTPAATTETKPTTTAPATPSPDSSTTTTPEGKPSVLNEKEPEGAPKEYEAFKVPDGHELDGEVAKEAGALFKEMKLSQTDAQKLVDFYVKQTQEATDAPYKVWEQKQEEWRQAIANDPDIGSKLPQVKVTVSRMLDVLGDAKLASEFRQALDFTGAGNHPAVVKAMFKLASMVTEGAHVSGRNPSEHGQRAPGVRPESAAKAMYPNLP